MALRVIINIFEGLIGIAIGVAILKGLGSLVGLLIATVTIKKK
ncbi:MAG TPA: hypothetical protein PLV23_04465 [Sedimentibacter sp.]|nr:hypothetical protein [Sedimentibacter sp.]